ncbi:DUF86 domain-containing protein [Candidatus Woesearchaeota archaeon]|nr:DUF86 domain-containing protein [Candidatus Woesearchaeota archaeon]
MNERIIGKIQQIGVFLEEFEPFIPSTLEEYLQDLGAKAICERYFEKIVEAIADLGLIIIKQQNFDLPEEESETFNILAAKGIIPPDLASRLKRAKGMRNIISHQYGQIDDAQVFHAVKEELASDVNAFLDAITGEHKK